MNHAFVTFPTLAKRLGGRCSSEGAAGSWESEPEKFVTYAQWRRYCEEGC